MDPRDVSPYEMSELLNMNDGELEALCAGQVPSDDERLGDLAGFLNDFAEVHPEPSTKPYEETHLSAMFETARLMADKGDPAAMPASKAHGPAVQASGLPKPGRETVFSKLKSAPLYTKIASALVALMLVFSGVAVAGALPGPVQDAVADGVAAVGIDLPGGVDEAATQPDDSQDDAVETSAEEADDDVSATPEDQPATEAEADDDAVDPNLADEDPRVDAQDDENDDEQVSAGAAEEDDDDPVQANHSEEADDDQPSVDQSDDSDDDRAHDDAAPVDDQSVDSSDSGD